MGVYDAALAWCRVGASVVPPAQDGTKRPLGEWKKFTQTAADFKQIDAWYADGTRTGVGLVTGKVSGNLEMLELEGRATTSEHLDLITLECEARGVRDHWTTLLEGGYLEWTPSGGLHLIYRVVDHEVPGNTKIARRPATAEELAENPLDKIKTLSETRGEGGYVVVAPTHGTVHPSGEAWEMPQGVTPGVVLRVSWETRCKIHEAIHAALDQMPEPEPVPAPRPRPTVSTGEKRPGDEFNDRHTWQDLLLHRGWHWVYKRGDKWYLRRPGKDEGTSATISDTTDRLWVFSSSTEFEPEHHYSKFEAYALLEHGGNFANAARELSARGFGTQRTTVSPFGTLDVPQATASGIPVVPVPVPSASVATVATVPASPVADWRQAPISGSVLRSYTHDFEGAASMIGECFHPWFRYIRAQKDWKAFDGKAWRTDHYLATEQSVRMLLHAIRDQAARESDDDSKKIMKDFAKKLAGASSAQSVLNWARCDPRMLCREEDFDPDPNLVTVGNGVLNLETRELHPHDPKFMNTKLLGASYDPDAKAPRWEKFLEDILPDAEVRGYIQRAIGHTLTGKAEQRALFLLHGKSGTGKSQFIRAMELMFGDLAETAAAATFTSSAKNATITNDLNDLKGSRFVSLSELEQDERMQEASLKRITGSDTAKSRALWQENTKWKVQFTLWMATNHLPRLNSDDNAIWRRVKPIAFNRVAEENGGEVLSIAEKIFAEEASGILNWMLDGVQAYLAEGLGDIEPIKQGVIDYRNEVDVVQQFMRDGEAEGQILVGDESHRVTVRVLHQHYVSWSRRNNMSPLGERRFSQRVSSLGYDKKVMTAGTVWVGITVNTSQGLLGTMDLPYHQRR